MNTQNILPPDSNSAALVVADRPSGIRLTAPRGSEIRVSLEPPADTPPLLHASQVAAVAADEIDWLYEHVDDETSAACIRARALIEGRIEELSPEHQAVIALHHDPTPWPEDLAGHEEDSFALILHALCPSSPRDLLCCSPWQLAWRARRRFEIGLEIEGPRALTRLIRRARWQFEDALRAYARVRGRGPSVVPSPRGGAACN